MRPTSSILPARMQYTRSPVDGNVVVMHCSVARYRRTMAECGAASRTGSLFHVPTPPEDADATALRADVTMDRPSFDLHDTVVVVRPSVVEGVSEVEDVIAG